MTEEFRKQQAMTVRAIAEKADPFTRKCLLDLAEQYDRKAKGPTPLRSNETPTEIPAGDEPGFVGPC